MALFGMRLWISLGTMGKLHLSPSGNFKIRHDFDQLGISSSSLFFKPRNFTGDSFFFPFNTCAHAIFWKINSFATFSDYLH